MFCKECGAEVDDDVKFCPKCGKKLDESSNSNDAPTEKKDSPKSKSMGVALIISIIFSGLGIAYAGNVKKGIIVFIVSLICSFINPGICLAFWLYGLYATYIEVNHINNKSNKSFIEKIRTLSKPKKFILFVVVLVIFLVISLSASSDDGVSSVTDNDSKGVEDNNISEADFKASCTSIDYKQLTKNSGKYYGDHIVVSGKVLEIQESGSGGLIRLATDGGYDDVVAVKYSGTNDVVEDDIITVYGCVSTDFSYQSQANYHITIPCVIAEYIE